ncbi:MAG: laccase domain protein [Planctomycetia bacterium]
MRAPLVARGDFPMNLTTVQLKSTPIEDSAILQFPALLDIAGFRHAVTTRPWNMAPHRGPDSHEAISRRKKVCNFLKLPFEHLTAPDQVHSPHVLRILPADVGSGRDGRQTAIKFVDGLVCDLPNVPVMQFSADCPVVLVVDPTRRVFGTAHASWRGTVTHIVVELINLLRSEFDIDPAQLIAAICPCAGPDEYEVGQDVRRIALSRVKDAERFFHPFGEKWLFDMRSANAAQLIECGVPANQIHIAAHSTMSDHRFYSHRRDGSETGRFALFAGFRDA